MKRRVVFISSLTLALLITVKSPSAKPWTVVDAVQSAISTHPQSLIAETIVEEARGERRSATALSAPVLTTRWDNIPSNKGFSDFEERRIGITQDLELPLRYIWLTKAANLTVDQARSESQAVLLDLKSEVRQAYLEAWAFSEQVKILKEYKDTLNTYGSQIQVISEQGGISRLDARKSRVVVAEAEQELRASQLSMTAAFDRLSRMTNFDLGEVELISPLKSDPVDTTHIDESKLFSTNPEVLMAESEVLISGCEETLASTAWLPEVELTYFVRDEIPQDDEDSWAFQLELSIPVWFWWGGAGEIQASRAQLRRAQAELAACRIETASECVQLTQEVRAGYERYELYRQELLPLAEDVYRMTQRNFSIGGADYLELIDEWEELKDVQLDNIETITELYEKKIWLDRLRGN